MVSWSFNKKSRFLLLKVLNFNNDPLEKFHITKQKLKLCITFLSSYFKWCLLKSWVGLRQIYKYSWYDDWSGLVGEWPSGLRYCSKNRKVPGSNPTRRSVGLRDPTSIRGSQWPTLGSKNVKTQWLTSGEWGCPLENRQKLAVGQPNRS